MDTSLTIFDYINYREYIRDYITSNKNNNSKYSLIYFSRAIKVSDSYLKLVVNGKRSLNIDKANQLAEKFKLKSIETSYFLTLIMLENAKSESMKHYYQNILLNYKSMSINYTHKQQENISIFQDILSWEIFSLVGVEEFNDDPEWICEKLHRKGLNKTRVANCLQNLKSKGLIKKLPDNNYIANDLILEDGDDVKYVYSIALDRAGEHLRYNIDKQSSYFDSFCLILSETELKAIKQILTETKGKIAELVKRKGPKSLIAFLNMNFFRASY